EDVPELWGGHESTVAHVEDLLRELMERVFIVKRAESTISGETEYAFKHGREREAVTQLTSRVHSESFHKLAGEWLECRLGNHAEKHCVLLARHFEAANYPIKSSRYYLLAGDGARGR